MEAIDLSAPRNSTIATCLAWAQSCALERLDAQLLLLHALGRDTHDRAWLLAHDTDPVSADVLQRFDALCARRNGGEPLAYITGHKEFFGLDLLVDARVLVPRPDTETLVQWALDLLAHAPRNARALDLGTGSGAIALALRSQRADLHIDAVDASADALAVARAHAQRLDLPVCFHAGHWFAALPVAQPRYDLIASNPPYIAEHDPHLPALAHEPHQALTSGATGLDDIAEIVRESPAHLASGGWLLLEHGYNQAADVAHLLHAAGFAQITSRQDLAGMTRCSAGQWRTAAEK